MYFTIYKITNLLNGKFYIGKHQTKNLDDGYFGSGKLLRLAIDKYGKENFKKEILEVHDTEEAMNAAEARLVNLSKESYNLCEGGNGGFGYINQNGLANRFTVKDSVKGGNYSKKFKTGIFARSKKEHTEHSRLGAINSPKFLGKKHTEETKLLISKNHHDISGSNNPMFGKKRSEETKRKISESLKRRNHVVVA